MGPIEIQETFAALAGQIPGVKRSLPYEPGQARLPEMPCVTMLFVGPSQVESSTGFMDINWNWDVFVYVSFSDAQRAQNEMLAIVPGLLKIVRENTTLGGVCDVSHITDGLSTPELGPEDRWLRKRMRLMAQTEEDP